MEKKNKSSITYEYSLSDTASRLGKGKEKRQRRKSGWMTLCPAHADNEPSLSVDSGTGDEALWHCFAGCSHEKVRDELASLGLISSSKKGSTADISFHMLAWNNAIGNSVKINPYFENRGITDIPRCFRWSEYQGDHMILAPVKVTGNDQIIGLQRIYVDILLYEKIETKMLGSCSGGGIWFDKGEHEKLIVGEGIETVLSARQAMKMPSVAALSTAGMVKIILPESVKELFILVDSDPNRAGQRAAKELAERFGGVSHLVTPDDSCFSDNPEKWDFNDIEDEEIRERFKKSTVYEKTGADTIEDELEKLVGQRPIEQDVALKKLAKTYKISVTTLRAELKSYEEEKTQVTDFFTEIEPFADRVDGYELIIEIKNILEKHVILPELTSLPIAVWCLLTYCFNSFSILPILGVISPEKRCGKTTLLEVISGIVNKPLIAANISSASVFRVIEKYYPTLLVDEADTSLLHNEELRGILNSGHRRKSAFVVRTNPTTLEVERFATFTPKVIALIGRLPDTLNDRSVIIQLRRKLANEKTEKMGLDFDEKHIKIRQKCLRWAVDHEEELKTIKPEIPEVGNDRTADNWTPLLTIATAISDNCYQELRECMLKLTKKDNEQSLGTQLLADIESIFLDWDVWSLASTELVKELNDMKESPWSEINKGKELTMRKLSQLLKEFDIKSKTIRIAKRTKKGYTYEDFEDDFSRYLPPLPPSET